MKFYRVEMRTFRHEADDEPSVSFVIGENAVDAEHIARRRCRDLGFTSFKAEVVHDVDGPARFLRFAGEQGLARISHTN
jgi:hypothetical protein